MRRNAATILLFAGALAVAAAVAIVLSGGFSSAALILRDWRRPAIAAGVFVALALAIAPRGERQRLVQPYRITAARLAVVASLCTLIFSIAWTSRAAGGSDSSCYVLQAEAFARGHATLDNPVARVLPGAPNAVFAPTGFLPGREYGHAVPICAPGLSLAMAAAYLIDPAAVFLVVPIAAAALVWLTFAYGRRFGDECGGAAAAVLVACSPIFLYQAVQPMSDVPAATAWMASLVATSPLAAGLWASVAVLIRPNLALLIPLLALTGKRGQPPFFAKKGDSHLFSLLSLGAGVMPGLLVLLALNAARYGSPIASGYGQTGALFAWAHVTPNLVRYPRWVIETHTPFVLLAAAAPVVLRNDHERARLAWASLAAVAVLAVTYLAYTVFDDWWYIRFLLPALPIAMVLAIVVFRALVRRAPESWGPSVTGVLTALLSVSYLHVARERHAMELQSLESRFALAGDYARRALPTDAVVLSVQQSGSIRFHGRRDTIAWDAIPDGLDDYLVRLRVAGRAPWLALEDEEVERFRSRFPSEAAAVLDEQPTAEVHAPVRVRFYELRR